MNCITDRKRILLTAILFIAVLVRFIFIVGKEIPILADSVIYLQSGKNFVETGKYMTSGGGMVDMIFPPAFPVAVGLADHFLDNPLFSLRFVSFIFGSLLVYLFYLTAAEMSGKKAGLFAAFFAAINPSLILFSQEVMSESMFFFFALLSFYLYLKLEKKQKSGYAACLGISIGISYLIRPEGLLLFVLPMIYLFERIRRIELRILGMFLLSLSVAIAVMSPYVMFLSQKTGKPTITAKMSTNLAAGINFEGADMSRLSSDEFLRYEENEGNYAEETNSLDYPKDKFKDMSILTALLDENFPKRFFRGVKSEIYALMVDHWAGFLSPLIFLAILRLIADKKKKNYLIAPLAISILLFTLFPIFHIESRYLLQVLIFLILIASSGWTQNTGIPHNALLDYLLKKRADAAVKVFTLALTSAGFLVFMYLSFMPDASKSYCNYLICLNTSIHDRSFPPTEKNLGFEYKIAGEFIKGDLDQEGKRAIIMSRRPIETSFYAGVEDLGITLPDASALNVIRFAKANNVEYIVVDKRYLGIRKNYEDLANLDKFSSDVKLAFEDSSVADIKVYKLE